MSNGIGFSITDRIRSAIYATKGILIMLISEHNAWLHGLATVLVCAAGIFFGVTRYEWCWVVLAIVSVWMAEAFNTALELLCDVTSPDFHPLINQAKDVAAGAVLITAIGAVIIGALIFWPYFAKLI